MRHTALARASGAEASYSAALCAGSRGRIQGRYRAGFTLIELMIVLVIAVVLVTIAVPAFSTFLNNQRVTTQANNLVTAIHLARSEAVKRGDVVELCASSDASSCNSSDWSQGWIVREPGVGGDVIRVWGSVPQPGHLNANDTSLSEIEFNALGGIEGSGDHEFELWFDECSGAETRLIELNKSGRPSMTRNNVNCG